MRSRQRNTVPPELLRRARTMRHEQTLAEQVLWMCLRNRATMGVKFRRQHPLGKFIVDFCCTENRLIIEIDGPTHEGQEANDAARESWLGSCGYRVMRVTNADVLLNLEGVRKTIVAALTASPHPNPLPEERGEGTKP